MRAFIKNLYFDALIRLQLILLLLSNESSSLLIQEWFFVDDHVVFDVFDKGKSYFMI